MNDDHDEVLKYEMGNFISSNEVVWGILSFPIHEGNRTVVHLNFHFENVQKVYLTIENAAQHAEALQDITLRVFFKLCTQDEFASTLLCNLLFHFLEQEERRTIGARATRYMFL